jgi:hypothetical protein
MKRITQRFFPLILAFSFVICLQALLAPSASAHTAARHIPAPASRLYVTHVVFTGDVNYSEYGVVIAPGTGANISKAWTVSNTFGASLGISADVVSAGVNFNVTESQSVTETCTAPTNTTGHDELLEWESIFAHYNYDIYSQVTGAKVGTGWAEKYAFTRCAIY